jgi:hypothetical protein
MLKKVVDDLYFRAIEEGDGSKVHSLTLGELLIEANFGAGEVQVAIHTGYMDFIFLYGEPVAEILEAIEKAYVKVDDVPTEILVERF